MVEHEQALLERLRTRVHQMLLQDASLRRQNESLRQHLDECRKQNADLTEQLKQLNASYANLKIAKTMELSEADQQAAYRRLTRLIRQVDECMAQLKR